MEKWLVPGIGHSKWKMSHNSLENWLVPGIGQSKCKMSLGHVVPPENEVWGEGGKE